jgi:hypothetical protein
MVISVFDQIRCTETSITNKQSTLQSEDYWVNFTCHINTNRQLPLWGLFVHHCLPAHVYSCEYDQ